MKKSTIMLATAMLSLARIASAEQVIFDATTDFFTTPWSFGAPYVRDEGRDHLGTSTPSPFLMGTAWEENTYFLFDNFDSGLIDGPVTSATLRVGTVVRAGLPTDINPSEASPFYITAHRVLGDPASINPSTSSSYVSFKDTQIGAAEDTIGLTSFGIANWDVTDLVNEWIANGDANFDFSLAMSGRIGNLPDSESSWFVGFVNTGFSGQAAQLFVDFTPTPEPGAAVLALIGVVATMRVRRLRAKKV